VLPSLHQISHVQLIGSTLSGYVQKIIARDDTDNTMLAIKHGQVAQTH
jgi:putative N-acetylmannosamine-6-phosphate epimerase